VGVAIVGRTRWRAQRGAAKARIQRKNYRIDVAKLERTQRILGTRTETETIHRALDLVAEEGALILALRDFVIRGGGRIEDVDARS
jgi:Arc/MetJ family transcription regulator